MNHKFKKSPNLTKMGIIGGGQLGRMMILEGRKFGIKFIILDPDENCPSASVADEQVIGGYYDTDKIRELAQKCDVITYELEHINADVLIELMNSGYEVQPSPNTLKMIQDKYEQKSFLRKHNIETTPFEKVDTIEDINAYGAREGFPIILKNCHGGYDGKGNKVIEKTENIENAYDVLDGKNRKLMIEKYISFVNEISVIAARSIKGDIKIYPISENIHFDNILRTTIVPARITEEVKYRAEGLALKVMEKLDGAGVFCIEMFVDSEGLVAINEIAPRVHNSGHYTLEGCNVSQFEQQIRATLGYPLADPYLIKPSVMINLLGEENMEGTAIIDGFSNVLEDNDAYIHFYGKEHTKSLRKMGHVTVLGKTIEDALNRAENIRSHLKITSS